MTSSSFPRVGSNNCIAVHMINNPSVLACINQNDPLYILHLWEQYAIIMSVDIQKRRYTVEVCDAEVDNNGNRIKRAKKMKTKIIDLNDDCLEKLFLYLRLKDLGNIAMSNTRFTNSADYVFNKLYANTLIVFDPCTSNSRRFNTFINILDGFGDSIRKLHVTFYHEQRYKKRNQQILQRIVNKCSKSVTELKLTNAQNDIVMSKPFLHLHKLTLTDSYFSDSMAQFIQSSPNVCCLEFYTVSNVFNASFVEQRVPLMTHFTNYNQVITDSEVENLQKFRRFVNVNEQLTSLCVGDKELEAMFRYEEIHRQFYKTIHRKLPYPDQSSLITYLMPFEPLYFGNMKHLNLSLGYSTDFLHCLRRRRIANLPVEQLEFVVGHLNNDSVDFILQCRHLKKLQLYLCEHWDIMNFVAVALNLPRMTELELYIMYDIQCEQYEYTIVVDVLRAIIKNNERIRRIVVGLQIERPSDSKNLNYEQETADDYQKTLYEEINAKLPNDWHVNFVTQNMEVRRPNSRESFFLCCIVHCHSEAD